MSTRCVRSIRTLTGCSTVSAVNSDSKQMHHSTNLLSVGLTNTSNLVLILLIYSGGTRYRFFLKKLSPCLPYPPLNVGPLKSSSCIALKASQRAAGRTGGAPEEIDLALKYDIW